MKYFLKNISIGKWKIPFPVILWFSLATIAVLLEMSRGLESFNNFILYKHVFIHLKEQHNLYVGEPFNLFDNHYGPFFSLIIAPFSFFGDYVGCFLWCIVNAWVLFYAIQQLPISDQHKMMVLLISALEMMTATHSVQFNTMLTGWIVLSYVLVEKELDFWAVLFIAAGFLVKLYGIVGLAFFFFSKHKVKFVLSFIFWMIVLICLPMIISSPSFVIQSYADWFYNLKEKDLHNTNALVSNFMQDISVMGMARRIFKIDKLSNFAVIIPAAIIYALPLLRIKQFKYLQFRLSYLSLALIGIVIFSSASESPTFVIAMVGVAIWFIIQNPENNKISTSLLVFAFILTCLSPTDLIPHYIKDHFIRPYSLKALPCFIIWLVIAKQLIINKKWQYPQVA